MFAANIDATSKVTNAFPHPVNAYSVRVRPIAWNYAFNLRLELLQCKSAPVDISQGQPVNDDR